MIRGIALIILASSALHLIQGNTDGPEESVLGATVFDIYRHFGTKKLEKSFLNYFKIESFKSKLGKAGTLRKPPASPECEECMDIIALGNAILDLGFTFEQLRDWGVAICEDIFNETNPPMVIICPGAIDIHGYHLYRTFADRDITPEQACTIWNYCLESEVEPSSFIRRNERANLKKNSQYMAKLNSDPSLNDVHNSSFKVVHLSDIHVDHQYQEGSAPDCGLLTCCRSYWPGLGSAGRWGEHQCNTPIRTINSLLRQVQDWRPDVVIYSGDNGPHSPWNETLEEQKQISAFIADTLTRHFPGTLIFSTIGNHESYPTNHYKLGLPESREFNEGFAEWWRRASRLGQSQVDSIRKGAYYTSVIKPGLRVISYNTQYAHTGNLYVLHTIDAPEYEDMKTFIRNALATANQEREKVIMVSHHPTGTEHTTVDFSRFITEVCLEYADTIVLHAFGHWHKDEFRLFLDQETGSAIGVQTMMSSVTPKGGGNPTARLLYLHPSNYTIMDYQNYFMTIRPQEGTEPVLTPMYRFTEEYSLPDASPESFSRLVDRMEREDSVLQKFWRNRQGRSGNEEDCNSDCKKTLLCRLRNTVYDQYRSCIDLNK